MSSYSTDEFNDKFKNKDYKVYQSLLMSDQNMASSQQDHHLLPPTLWNVHPSPSGFPYTTSRSRSSAPGSSWLLCRNPIGSLLPQLGGKRNVQLVLQLLTPATWGSRIQLILGSDEDGWCRLPHPLGAKGWPKRWNDVKLSPCPASLMRNASEWDPM